MQRITKSDLEATVERINKALGTPLEPYTKVNGKYQPNANCRHLEWAYGGVKMVRMCNTGTGTDDTLPTGFGTKRELFDAMHSYLIGLGDAM